jgi:hypothetical protein
LALLSFIAVCTNYTNANFRTSRPRYAYAIDAAVTVTIVVIFTLNVVAVLWWGAGRIAAFL